MAARLKELYNTTVTEALTKEFGYTNPMAVPRINKISVNIGLGEATGNAKLMDGAARTAKAAAAALKKRRTMGFTLLIELPLS